MSTKMIVSLFAGLFTALSASANVTYQPLVRCEGGRVVLDQVNAAWPLPVLSYQVVVNDYTLGNAAARMFAFPTNVQTRTYNNGHTTVFTANHFYPTEKIPWSGATVELKGTELTLRYGPTSDEPRSNYREWIFRGCVSTQ